MSVRILNTIGEAYDEEAKKILNMLGAVDYQTFTQNKLQARIKDYDIAVIGLGLNFDKAVFQHGSKLKLIATATTGLDHINLEYAKAHGIEVVSLMSETTFLDTITGTAELAVGLMLDLMRGISAGFQSVKRYEWDRERFCGYALRGKVLGVVGLGRLGKMVARYGRAFGMEVLTYDPYPELDFCKAYGVKAVSFDVLVQESDTVSIHVPLNRETENMFHAGIFTMMKPTSYLINTARGKIVNEQDLLHALQSGCIAGYAADVLAEEVDFGITFSSHPLVDYAKTHTNVIITPHIGGMTHESRAATDVFIAKKVVEWAMRHL